MTQPLALATYSYFEEWWGEELSPSLIRRISAAPASHVYEFENGLPSKVVPLPGLQDLPPLDPGELRPDLSPFSLAQKEHLAPRLSMYSSRVVEDWSRLIPAFTQYPRKSKRQTDSLTHEERAGVVQHLEWMTAVRPLVEQGALLFSDGANVDESGAIVLEAINERLDFAMMRDPRIRSLWRVNVARSALPIAMQLEAARLDRASPIALSDFEERMLRLLLNGYPLADKRVSAMSILARLDLPAFDSDPALAISVRASEEFTEFRRALQSSLLLIEEIAADGPARATDTVGVELQGALARLEKAARKSPSLAAARVGVRGLTFMGVGAAAGGIATGSALGAVAGGVSSKVAEAVAAYFEAVQERRAAKQVWNVISSFRSHR